MPSSSEAFTGKYHPKRTPPRQNDNRQSPESVYANVKELSDVSNVDNTKKIWIILTVSTVVALFICGGLAAAFVVTRTQSFPSNNDTSSTASITNSGSTTTIASGTNAGSSTISITVNSASTAGTTTVTSPVSLVTSFPGSSSWYIAERLEITSCTSDIANFSAVIVVQRTVNGTGQGPDMNLNPSLATQTFTQNSTQIIYTWNIASGQIIPAYNCPFYIAAKVNLVGTAQPTSGDTYEVWIVTTNGTTTTLSGHF